MRKDLIPEREKCRRFDSIGSISCYVTAKISYLKGTGAEGLITCRISYCKGAIISYLRGTGAGGVQ
jgi:hypothetical protein